MRGKRQWDESSVPPPTNSVSKFPLWLFRRESTHNHSPSRIDSLKNERSIVNCPVHKIPLRHIRFVRVHVDELPRSQNCCGKQNGELSFLGHAGTPAFCGMKFRREKRRPQSTFSCPTVTEAEQVVLAVYVAHTGVR